VSAASAHFPPPRTGRSAFGVVAALRVVVQDGTYTDVYGLDLIAMTDSGGSQKYFADGGRSAHASAATRARRRRALCERRKRSLPAASTQRKLRRSGPGPARLCTTCLAP
jgi:hypothetical protein